MRPSTFGIKESKHIQKPKSRKFCFFEIKSNWSILGQIMISLLILTLLTLIYVTSQVLVGLFVSKYFFQQFSKTALYSQAESLYTTEAKLLQNQVQNQSQFSQSLLSQYQLVNNQSLYRLVNFSIGLAKNNSDFIEYDEGGQNYYLAGNYENSRMVVLVLNATDVMSQGDQLIIETNTHFNANFNYTIYLISGSFVLILLLGWCFALYIVRPLKKLTQYAQHINQNTTRLSAGKQSKKKPIELKDINAQDKIGELVNEFKNLIQGLAGLKKGNIQKKTQEIKPFLQGYENQNQEEFKKLLEQVNDIKVEKNHAFSFDNLQII